jgi:hypothetical protein
MLDLVLAPCSYLVQGLVIFGLVLRCLVAPYITILSITDQASPSAIQVRFRASVMACIFQSVALSVNAELHTCTRRKAKCILLTMMCTAAFAIAVKPVGAKDRMGRHAAARVTTVSPI